MKKKNTNQVTGCLALLIVTAGIFYFCHPSEWNFSGKTPSAGRQSEPVQRSREETIRVLKCYKEKGKDLYARAQEVTDLEELLSETMDLEKDFASIRPELIEIRTLPGTSTEYHGENLVEIVHSGLFALVTYVSYKIDPPEDDSLELAEKEVNDLLVEMYYIKTKE